MTPQQWGQVAQTLLTASIQIAAHDIEAAVILTKAATIALEQQAQAEQTESVKALLSKRR